MYALQDWPHISVTVRISIESLLNWAEYEDVHVMCFVQLYVFLLEHSASVYAAAHCS